MTKRERGFTLIEVLIAIAVLGLVLLVLGQALAVGSRALAAYQTSVRPQEDLEPVEQALRHLVERMDPGVYPEPPFLKAEHARLAFTTELPDDATGSTIEADVGLGRQGDDLVLTWTPHGRGAPFGPPARPRETLLLHGISGLAFDYASKTGDGSWRETWTEAALPGLVRIRIVQAGGTNGHAWPPIVVRTRREQAEE